MCNGDGALTHWWTYSVKRPAHLPGSVRGRGWMQVDCFNYLGMTKKERAF
jgi:hypothetical protein